MGGGPCRYATELQKSFFKSRGGIDFAEYVNDL